MQNLLLKLASLGLILAVVLFTACGEDDPLPGGGSGVVLGPELSFVSDPTAFNTDFDIEETETSFTVIVRTSKGDANLKSLTITENGTSLPTGEPDGRLTVSGGGLTTANNPLLIAGTAVDGADYTFTITLPDGISEGDVFAYVFDLEDDNGEKAVIDIVATVVAPPGTPLDNLDGISGVLLNQAGPAGTGGLDLDAGAGTGSTNAAAEIRDLGIDCTIPVAQENWRALFGTVNGAEMVRINTSMLENFSYESVSTKEAIADAFNSTAAVELQDGLSQAPNCDTTPVTDVSGAVVVGDIFAVKSGEKFYLLRVDAVNFVHSATDPDIRNDDNYEFSVKF
ncbi:MAG: hypothetical protein AAGJ82_03245 [Bacteroidota bacterium]